MTDPELVIWISEKMMMVDDWQNGWAIVTVWEKETTWFVFI